VDSFWFEEGIIMVNELPIYCQKYEDRDEAYPIIRTNPGMYPEGEGGSGLNEFPVELCLGCGQSFIEIEDSFCRHCRSALSRQGSTHVGATPKGSFHTYIHRCDRCGLTYFSQTELS
jgi:hypothetical protein